MMKSTAQNNQNQTQDSSLTSPTTMTGTGSDTIAPLETNVQASIAFSDVFTRLECELNQSQSPIQTPKARAAALATVDQDIDAAKRLILTMLTHRNKLVPISILPAEILARIFHFNAAAASSARSYSPAGSLGWASVTHVCRHWRQVALDDSTLWAHFLTSSPRTKDWIAERLSRARNAPLVVELDTWMGTDTVSLITSHISHTRELYFRVRELIFYSAILQEISTQKAPALECLDLSVSNPSPIMHFPGHSFFNGPVPKLRILRVSQILFPWSLVPRGRLTQLNVTLSREPFTSEPEFSLHNHLDQLVDLLVNCPELELLTLKNCLPATLSQSSGGQTIHLPRLSHLCLGGSGSRVRNLLKMLKLSSSTTLRLNCTHEVVATQNEHVILSILSAHFNNPTPIEFRSFKINLDHINCIMDMVTSTSLPISPIPYAVDIQVDPDIGAELSLSLSFLRVPDFDNVMHTIVRQACEVLPLSKLEFLSIVSPITNQPVNWGEVFRPCTEVTTVQVYGHGTIGLLEALTPPQHSRGKGRKGRRGRGTRSNKNDNSNSISAPVHVPIFPKLTSLLLEGLDFNDVVPGSGVLFDLVLGAVKWLRAKKTPLTTLCIDRCAISAEEASKLEKVVPDFRWDHDDGGVGVGVGEGEDDNDDDDDDENDDDDYDDHDHPDTSDIDM